MWKHNDKNGQENFEEMEQGPSDSLQWTVMVSKEDLALVPSTMLDLEKEMATHSSVLAWRIPGTEEPGGLLSSVSHRIGHDWSDLEATMLDRPRAFV